MQAVVKTPFLIVMARQRYNFFLFPQKIFKKYSFSSLVFRRYRTTKTSVEQLEQFFVCRCEILLGVYRVEWRCGLLMGVKMLECKRLNYFDLLIYTNIYTF